MKQPYYTNWQLVELATTIAFFVRKYDIYHEGNRVVNRGMNLLIHYYYSFCCCYCCGESNLPVRRYTKLRYSTG